MKLENSINFYELLLDYYHNLCDCQYGFIHFKQEIKRPANYLAATALLLQY